MEVHRSVYTFLISLITQSSFEHFRCNHVTNTMKRKGVVTTSDEIETAYVTLDTQREEGKRPWERARVCACTKNPRNANVLKCYVIFQHFRLNKGFEKVIQVPK